jgi:hypothetical protein
LRNFAFDFAPFAFKAFAFRRAPLRPPRPLRLPLPLPLLLLLLLLFP